MTMQLYSQSYIDVITELFSICNIEEKHNQPIQLIEAECRIYASIT